MATSVRPRRLWPWAIVLGVIAVVVVAAFFADIPARRYMEREINRRLTGYTVSVGALHIHPWTVSLELLDSQIFQNANPDPPVARIRSLTTTIHWPALFHHRVVADVIFDRPSVYVNIVHLRAEAANPTPIKDEGWQHALEAVTLDLKINRLEVRDGDVTYVDTGGPFAPLRLTKLSMLAENIRNVRSKEREYPSDIHMEGVVFDTGTLWLDGHADFLAEPNPAVKAALRLDGIDLGYFKPVTSRYNLLVHKGTLSLAGNLEYAPKIASLVLDQVSVDKANIEYVHKPSTAGAEQARAGKTAEAAKSVANEPGYQLEIKHFAVRKSTLALVSHVAQPPYRLDLSDVDLTVDNLSNQKIQGDAVVRLKGRFMESGDAKATMTLRPSKGKGGADLELSASVVDTDMARLNNFVHQYGGFNVQAGVLTVFTELKVTNGNVTGYVKPLFRDVKVGTPPGEPEPPKTFGQRLWQGAVGLATKILKNRPRREVATVVTISGQADQPVYKMGEVVGHLLQNAFIKAILPGFEPERSPAPEKAPTAEGSPHEPERAQAPAPSAKSGGG